MSFPDYIRKAAFSYWRLAIGYWLLAFSCLLLAVNSYWLLAVGGNSSREDEETRRREFTGMDRIGRIIATEFEEVLHRCCRGTPLVQDIIGLSKRASTGPMAYPGPTTSSPVKIRRRTLGETVKAESIIINRDLQDTQDVLTAADFQSAEKANKSISRHECLRTA